MNENYIKGKKFGDIETLTLPDFLFHCEPNCITLTIPQAAKYLGISELEIVRTLDKYLMHDAIRLDFSVLQKFKFDSKNISKKR